MNVPEMVTIKQAASRINISEYAIRRWVKAGMIRSVKSGNRVYIPLYSVINFLYGNDYNKMNNSGGLANEN